MQIKIANLLTYDPDHLTPGVVHIGLGSFSRAFLGEYFHDVARQGYTRWAIVGIKPMTAEHDPALRRQNHLYTLIKRNGDEVCTPIGILYGVIPGKNNAHAVVMQIADPLTKLVTLTITPKGYCLGDDKKFDLKKVAGDVVALIRNDLDSLTTVPGWLTAALMQRYEENREPFTILSCDNFPRNGELLQNVIFTLVDQLRDRGFSAYVREACSFPNCVVDRIVPLQNQTTNAHHVQKRYGYADESPILCEESRRWIIEDKFVAGSRPPLDKADVLFVPSTEPYERLKLYAINGSHLALGIMGKLLEINCVHETMADQGIRTFIENYLRQVTASFRSEVAFDLDFYQKEIISRFSNEQMPDYVHRLLSSTGTKIVDRLLSPKMVDPSLSPNTSAFAIAAWLRYLRGTSEKGTPYQISDEDVKNESIHCLKDPEALVGYFERLGSTADKAALRQFAEQVMAYYELMERRGLREVLDETFVLPTLRPQIASRQALPHSPAGAE